MGQSGGGLHHSEGSKPLPHQAGKRLPPTGFKNTYDSALKEERWDLDSIHMHIKQAKGGKGWTDYQHLTGNWNNSYSWISALVVLSTLYMELSLKLFFTCCFTVYLRAFLGISHSFCLTSNCKLAISSYSRENTSQQLFFPQALNPLDFPKTYLLFIDIFINMLFISKWFVFFSYNIEMKCLTL